MIGKRRPHCQPHTVGSEKRTQSPILFFLWAAALVLMVMLATVIIWSVLYG
jgi:hypothetical protein